ncbi:MAG: Crp/Fnr family transcriptional regulator [Nitratireductor sp.]|jgi:CRP-like cAMP-binding protein|nr:Crp/Fnr family transcriptional regulator [Nitratireductor sp.]
MQQFQQSSADQLRNLAEIGWLCEQPPAFVDRIALLGRWVTLKRGERLYTAGEQPDAMYGLGEGAFDLAIPISKDEEVTVHRAGPGFWIGESALLSGNNRTISVTAAVDSRAFRISISAIKRNLSLHPADWMHFHNLTHMNGTLCISVLAEVISLPPKARFARMLLRMSTPDGRVRVTQEELGKMAGMSRAAFRRAFASLIDAAIVETGYRGLLIRDPAALERAANET